MAKKSSRSASSRAKKTSKKTVKKSAKKRTKKSAKKNARKARPAKAGAKTGPKTETKTTPRKWSQEVTEHSDALDLKKGVFTLKDPKKIAASLKASAEHSRRRKSGPYRSALSMLIFYMNRGGKNLPANRKRILQRAKRELRHQFGRG